MLYAWLRLFKLQRNQLSLAQGRKTLCKLTYGQGPELE